MREIKNINIAPRLDCAICHGAGVVSGGSVPIPFGTGSCRLPDEYCDCVLDQLPKDDEDTYNIFLKFPEPETKPEEWEIAIGGNFLQIWEKDTYATMDILNFDNGKVAEIELPNYRKLDIHAAEAINMVMPRAYLIVEAPAMLRLLERALPIIEAEANQRDEAHMDSREVATDEYWREMRELANAVAREIKLANGRAVAETNPAEAETPNPDDPDQCPHGYGFVEYCPTCKDRKNDAEEFYDYAADDRNFDAERERRSFKR